MNWLDKTLNSQPVQFGLAGLAFLIALWLVIVIVRMMTGGKLRFNGGRTRQARLGIVDAFDLDRQRQLIIVRRDNTEHLILIGGPNDLLIESEIVRVEARESRRLVDKPEGVENRIPAPIMMPEGPSPDEPLLPMSLEPALAPEPVGAASLPPMPASPDSEALPPRTPTFPLPPRRVAPQPDRRPPPPPANATRLDEPAPPPLPQPVPEAPPVATFPPPPQIPPEPLPPIVPTQGVDVPPIVEPPRAADLPRPALRTPPPSFLKPLPPRPPIRPLRRATPVAPGAPGAPPMPALPVPEAAAPPPAVAAPEAVIAPPTHEPTPPQAPEAHPTVAAAEPQPETKPGNPDALESLEEEMAKLLGRG